MYVKWKFYWVYHDPTAYTKAYLTAEGCSQFQTISSLYTLIVIRYLVYHLRLPINVSYTRGLVGEGVHMTHYDWLHATKGEMITI